MPVHAQQSTVLVVGGAGYIGSHASYLLHTKGYRVVVLDDLKQHASFCPEWAEFVKGDFGDTQVLKSVFENYSINAVMHFAAFIEVGESVKNPAKYYDNNVVKTIALLDAMRAAGLNKIIFSSSAAVYGRADTDLIDENCPTAPVNPYGMTKLMVESILRDYDVAYGFRYGALRYFNVAGALPEQNLGERHEPETHIIPLLLRAALDEKSFKVFGDDYSTPDGTCIRDYLHVLDIADAHVKALEYLLNDGTSFICNLGTGAGYSVNQMIEAVSKVLGLTIERCIHMRREGDPAKLVASAAKAHALLGWQPQHSLEDAIQSAYAFEELQRSQKKPIRNSCL